MLTNVYQHISTPINLDSGKHILFPPIGFIREGGKLIYHPATQIYRETFLIILFSNGLSPQLPQLTTLGLNVCTIYLFTEEACNKIADLFVRWDVSSHRMDRKANNVGLLEDH